MTPSAPSVALAELAHAHGVATDFHDWKGAHTVISDTTLRTVLGALGVDASSDEAVQASLADAENRPWRRTLPATVVCREGWTPWVHAHVPHGAAVRLTIELEDDRTDGIDHGFIFSVAGDPRRPRPPPRSKAPTGFS